MTNSPVESLHFEMDPSQPILQEHGMGRPASPVGKGKVPTMPMMGRRDSYLQAEDTEPGPSRQGEIIRTLLCKPGVFVSVLIGSSHNSGKEKMATTPVRSTLELQC